MLNTAIAISIAIGLFATVLHYAPFPVSALAIACVPLLELAILLKKTPKPYHERDEVPIFKPLPINRGKFVMRFGAPVLVLGIALGHAALELAAEPCDEDQRWCAAHAPG